MSSFLNNFDISGYGLSAQRFRVNLISENIANAQTTRTDEGGPYRRREAIFKAVDFDEVYNKELNKNLVANSDLMEYEDPLREHFVAVKPNPPMMSVMVDKVVRDDSAPNLKYDPSHPDANKEGYVSYPNINPVVEMADLVEATRAYQANVAAFESTKNMAQSAISLFQG
jgi:flagellar basal-body rod protein FlgC